MIKDIKMPQEGLYMADGIIASWLVGVGDTVEIGTPIAEIEVAKSTFQLESPYAGKIVELLFEPDDTVDVGDVIARINC